jgi:hypothetical protein
MKTARRTVRDIESDGHAVERVPVDVVALSEWCRERGLPLTGPSRAKYVLQLDR